MRKLYTLALFAIVSLSAFAEMDDKYYWFYDQVSAAPTGKGVVYASFDSEAPTDDLYSTTVEARTNMQGLSSTSLFVWAKPADGYQLAGWFTKYGDDFTLAEQVAAPSETSIYTTTFMSTDDDMTEGYGFEPDATYYGLFTKVRAQVGAGLSSVGTVDISKVANDAGDVVTLTATPLDESVQFDYWLDSKGNKLTANPCDITVSNVETYTAYFKGDSILTIDFGQGKYIPFSSQYAATLSPGITGWRVRELAREFYDDAYNTITFDEGENAWGYWNTTYDDETGDIISSEFVKYTGEIPNFDSTYKFDPFGYNLPANDGVILYGQGLQSIVLTNNPDPSMFDNYLVPTATAPVDLATLPAQNEEEVAMNYYVFDGTDFVKATSGTVAQGQCYLALDANQMPLPDKILFVSSEAVGIQSPTTAALAKTPALVGIYTIDGRQVKAPVNGLNIINGKKVLIK